MSPRAETLHSPSKIPPRTDGRRRAARSGHRWFCLVAATVVVWGGCIEWPWLQPEEPTWTPSRAAPEPQRATAPRQQPVVRSQDARPVVVLPVVQLHIQIVAPQSRISSIQSEGRLELIGASAPAGLNWTDAALTGELKASKDVTDLWTITGGTITLSDGRVIPIGTGQVLLAPSADSGMPAAFARLYAREASAAPAGTESAATERAPPAPPAAAPPPATVRVVSFSYHPDASDSYCVDTELSVRADIPRSAVKSILTLQDEAGAQVRVAAGAKPPWQPGHPLRIPPDKEGTSSPQYCLPYPVLALAAGERHLVGQIVVARVDTPAAPLLGSTSVALRLTMPRFYAVRVRVSEVKVKEIIDAADVAAALTFGLSAAVALPHGTPELSWGVSDGRHSFWSHRARRGTDMTSTEVSDTFMIPEMGKLTVMVRTARTPWVFSGSTEVMGQLAFTPLALLDAIRAAAPLSQGHILSLRLDHSEVTEMDMTREVAPQPASVRRRRR